MKLIMFITQLKTWETNIEGNFENKDQENQGNDLDKH